MKPKPPSIRSIAESKKIKQRCSFYLDSGLVETMVAYINKINEELTLDEETKMEREKVTQSDVIQAALQFFIENQPPEDFPIKKR